LPPVALDAADFDHTRDLWFDRCSGCHGTYRGGATGPALDEVRSKALGTDLLAAVIRHGTPWGMPGWKEAGVLSEEEVGQLAAFLQLAPPEAPGVCRKNEGGLAVKGRFAGVRRGRSRGPRRWVRARQGGS